MVCVVNVQSMEWIIFFIFNRLNQEWHQRTFANLHK